MFETAFSAEPIDDGRIEVGIGDDAAVLTDSASDRLVVSTDVVVDGVHVDLELGGLDDAGWKALMVAASDVAAMGAGPRHALLSVVAPKGLDLDALGRGVAEASGALGCRVVGGDLSEGRELVASVTVLGWLPDDGRPALRRSGALPGNHLFLTGPLGASAAGLRMLRAGLRPPRALRDAYLRPRARVAEGLVARRGGGTAAIDISDGLAVDVRHLAEASGVGLDLDAVPVAEGATVGEALGGGEDYELLLAVRDEGALRAAFADAGLAAPLPLGRCTAEAGRYRLGRGELGSAGWRHSF